MPSLSSGVSPQKQQHNARRKQLIRQQRKSLPIASVEKRLVDEVRKNDTLIVVGETGSGKTTQLPQFLYDGGFCQDGKVIGITQPRRVAAVTVAKRVAEECNDQLGRKVGYSIRFDDSTSNATRIKYMTDGLLLREALLDPLLSKYSVIVVDEAHERTVHTDVLLGLLKKVQHSRSLHANKNGKISDRPDHSQSSTLKACQGIKIAPLKLIIMSASLDAKCFSDYFGGAKAVHIQGRQYPVDTLYTYQPESDYLDATLVTIFQIHLEEGPGDILAFLTGQEEIESLERLIQERARQLPADSSKIWITPIYSSLPSEQQMNAFKPAPSGARKVVLATNIAETSVTIPGIKYVIDPGMVKARAYNPVTGMESLIIIPVSKAQALQRSGRAGREGPGKCFRLFQECEFDKLAESTIPDVISKVFYKSQKDHCEWAANAPVQSAQDNSVTDDDSREEKEDAQLEKLSVMATESIGNSQEQMLVEMYPDQDKPCSRKHVLDTADVNHENQINGQAETELDHMSLQERYRILLADMRSCSARVSAEKCALNDTGNSSMQMDAETSGPVPKSESEEINHEGTAYGEDICNMLQGISSAPSITDSMNDGNNVRLFGEIPQDTQISSVECFVNGKEISVEDTEGPVNDKTLNSSAELLLSQTPACGDENFQLAPRNSGTYLVDVKTEPALDGYAIYPSESPSVKFHHSNNDGLKVSGSILECIPKDAEDSLPSLGVKSEPSGYELPGLCENSFISSMEPIVKKPHTRTLNCNGGLAPCSRQRKKRKIAMDSSEKVLEEDAYKNDEGIPYPSRQKRKKKTATDSIETALEEDAPGLLQILLDKGIVVKEIKLYDVVEDDEMLPDCTESDFQDLENVITKLFPQRTSLLKSVARHGKGAKAIYCLACLISLIEQSRYLQFRDCPVEWGWCRDLQSFIFVFKSHNRLVLERPEYGYATYFFEILQSVPIEWQIRRMVTAMKLSSCGRTALIENRPLLVGEDLSEGEAKVLEEYGWIPNTGLGTLLNYRDRVVHDRWNERYSTDWRMKIGKLLMNGYSEGELIITHVPLNTSSEEIKLENP